MPTTPISFTCPTCQATHKAPARNAGRKIVCFACGQQSSIPGANPPDPPAKIPAPEPVSVVGVILGGILLLASTAWTIWWWLSRLG